MAYAAEMDTLSVAPERLPPTLKNTYWGYQIEEPEDPLGPAAYAEPVMRLLGLVLVLAAYGQWLLPPDLFPGDPLQTKLALAMLFASFGVGLYWFASRGRRQLVEVDLSRRQLRLAQITSRGEVRLRAAYAMDRVESASIRQADDPGDASELYLRIRGVRRPVLIATARETVLLDLHRRLAADLRPGREAARGA